MTSHLNLKKSLYSFHHSHSGLFMSGQQTLNTFIEIKYTVCTHGVYTLMPKLQQSVFAAYLQVSFPQQSVTISTESSVREIKYFVTSLPYFHIESQRKWMWRLHNTLYSLLKEQFTTLPPKKNLNSVIIIDLSVDNIQKNHPSLQKLRGSNVFALFKPKVSLELLSWRWTPRTKWTH